MEPIQDDIETVLTPEYLAQMFHETYERLALVYTYETRRESRVPWSVVPEPNRSLMLAVATEVLDDIKAELAPALDRLVAERDRLQAEAIRVYTSHLHLCSMRPCSCGAYSSLVEALTKTTEESG